jgi:hypothetical protein
MASRTLMVPSLIAGGTTLPKFRMSAGQPMPPDIAD